MGDYQPYQPQILGLSWVPIRDENTVFSPQVNTVEYGHGFHLDSARTLQEARVYVSEIPANLATDAISAAIYPRGLEGTSGPIRRVVIPVDAVAVTGVTASPSSLPGPAILLTPDLGGYYLFSTTVADSVMFLSFNTQAYTVLTGKRILGVNLLYAAAKFFGSAEPDLGPLIGIQDSTNLFGAIDYSDGDDIIEGGTLAATQTLRLRFGDRCPFPPAGITDSVPWIYPDDLGRFDASSASRLYVSVKTGQNHCAGGCPPTGGVMYFWYAALEVLFCEENRLAYGIGVPTPAQLAVGEGPDYGANPITLRTLPGRALWPVIQPGDYTVTIGEIDDGNRFTPFTAGMILNALRELYQIPTHPGLQIDIPYPPEDNVGDTFTITETRILPQISLHASGGTLTEPHVYGRIGPAPVYGSISAIQDIYDDPAGTSYQYPQVRFYARKYPTTTVPLKLDSTNVTGTGVNVQITPAEHDLLPEIVNGWKECTLRFPTAPSMGLVTPDPAWRFTSVGEQAGSRWEVLSACAPAISGVPGSLLTQATPVHRLGTATYQPPAGDTVELTWMSPYATGAVVDPDCDAVLLFSQDPPTVTGVSLTQVTQTVTGVALGCGSTPCCVPTGIGYNRITWGLPVNTGIADDDYNRTVAAGGWGTAPDGKAWTTSGTAGDFSVTPAATDPAGGTTPGQGLIDLSATGSDRHAWVAIGGPDQDVTVAVRIDEAAETSQLRAGVEARLTDANNQYRAEIRYTSTDTVTLILLKNVAGVATQLGSIMNILLLRPAATTPRMVRLQVQGSSIRAKTWDSDQPEPWWQIVATDTALTTGNNAGVYARDDTTTATSNFYYSGFTVRPPDFAFGALELQRFDPTTGGTFQTIMSASSLAVTGFNDYEARAGVTSVYRIRNLNVYQFAGAWSTQVSGAPPAPGVTGPCSDNTGVLIFTSNAEQAGARNCAYVPQWASDDPTEIFNVPEASRVQFQELYTRDGRIAFHGTERGLEAFTRQILIHAARPTPALLADVTTARDLVWADLPYVCVRDDLGNRWYANVRIPEVAVKGDRSKWLAMVDVVELTRTPAIVDPA